MSSRIHTKDFVALTATRRLGALRVWFLILLLLGLLAMLYVGYRAFFSEPRPNTAHVSYSLDSWFTATVYAQQTGQPADKSAGAMKETIKAGIVGVLALVLLLSLAAVLFAKDANRVSVAGDILKTVLGFFIGTATSYLGS